MLGLHLVPELEKSLTLRYLIDLRFKGVKVGLRERQGHSVLHPRTASTAASHVR